MMILRCWPAWLPFALLLAACGQQPTASSASRFAAIPPVIDGQTTEWADSLSYDLSTKLQYQVLNDGRAIYLRVKVANQATQAKLLRHGLVVWLDTTGRYKGQLGVRFPLRGQAGAPQPPTEAASNNQLDQATQLRQTLAGLHEMELLNYKGSKEPTLTDLQSPLGVKLAVGFDSQANLIYELAVPLRLLYRHLPVPAGSSGRAPVMSLLLVGSLGPSVVRVTSVRGGRPGAVPNGSGDVGYTSRQGGTDMTLKIKVALSSN